MSVEPTPGTLSRRTLLGGLGTAGALTFGAAVPATARQATATDSIPQATPALTYRVIDPSAFHPTLSTRERLLSEATGGVTVGMPTGMLAAPLDLTVGVTLREVRITYQDPAGGSTSAARLLKKALAGTYDLLAELSPLPQGDGWLEASLSVDEFIDGTATYMVGYLVQQAGQFVCGAVIGYEEPTTPVDPPAPPGFIAITPTPRVLDTRVAGGKLTAGEERVVALDVPGTAAAAVINLTVTETEQFGYLSVFPANIGWPGNSSINWSSSQQDIANTVISAVDASGQIRIRAGVSSTQVVVDVLGYFT